MSGKTISTGTLGLRFMQNAQRAKQLKEVEAERAPVKDDGHWEIKQEVRDAWGTGSSSSSQNVSHETSYLPFLFSGQATSTSPEQHKPKGRRVFNKHGQEEVKQEAEPTAPITEDQATESKTRKVHPRPKSISGAPGNNLFGFPAQQPKNTKTAKQAIYDNTGVGTDLRQSKTIESSPKPSPSVFLKPSGVDDPKDSRPSAYTDVIPGARSKKAKRERSNVDQPDGEGTNRKKKKSTG